MLPALVAVPTVTPSATALAASTAVAFCGIVAAVVECVKVKCRVTRVDQEQFTGPHILIECDDGSKYYQPGTGKEQLGDIITPDEDFQVTPPDINTMNDGFWGP
jgi:hypothetical protein